MATDHFRYDLLVQKALRGLFRDVLIDASVHGLPGEHHFFITFNTHGPGVRLSDRLREQYPDQMTIILQHQFWDLRVDDHGFEVGLSFRGIAEKLSIPFSEVTGFFDPSVNFGAKFALDESGESEEETIALSPPVSEISTGHPIGKITPAKVATDHKDSKKRIVEKAEASAHKVPRAVAATSPAQPIDEPKPAEAPPASDDETPNVVSIDAFRKKAPAPPAPKTPA